MQLVMDNFGIIGYDPINGRWSKLSPGYFKLNVDNNSREGKVIFGGILRDHQCNRVCNLSGNSSMHLTLATELLTLQTGLQLLLDRGYFRVPCVDGMGFISSD